MGTNNENHTDSNGKTPNFRGRRVSQLTPFVVRWRALQRELSVKTTRLDSFLAGISQFVATPRRVSGKREAEFRKSFLSNSIAS